MFQFSQRISSCKTFSEITCRNISFSQNGITILLTCFLWLNMFLYVWPSVLPQTKCKYEYTNIWSYYEHMFEGHLRYKTITPCKYVPKTSRITIKKHPQTSAGLRNHPSDNAQKPRNSRNKQLHETFTDMSRPSRIRNLVNT